MSKHVLTFESNPRFVDFCNESSLFENIRKIRTAPFENQVSIRAALNLLKGRDDVKRLIIVSDMKLSEADPLWPTGQKEEDADVKVYFWKVSFKNPPSFDTTRYNGITCITGFSDGLMRCICNGEELTPHNVMMNTLSDTIFDDIQQKMI